MVDNTQTETRQGFTNPAPGPGHAPQAGIPMPPGSGFFVSLLQFKRAMFWVNLVSSVLCFLMGIAVADERIWLAVYIAVGGYNAYCAGLMSTASDPAFSFEGVAR